MLLLPIVTNIVFALYIYRERERDRERERQRERENLTRLEVKMWKLIGNYSEIE